MITIAYSSTWSKAHISPTWKVSFFFPRNFTILKNNALDWRYNIDFFMMMTVLVWELSAPKTCGYGNTSFLLYSSQHNSIAQYNVVKLEFKKSKLGKIMLCNSLKSFFFFLINNLSMVVKFKRGAFSKQLKLILWVCSKVRKLKLFPVLYVLRSTM